MADACIQPAHWSADVDVLADMVVKAAQPGDHILVMSNGGFGGIHQKLLDGLAKKAAAAVKDPVALALTGPTSLLPLPLERAGVRGLLFVLRQLAQILENQAR